MTRTKKQVLGQISLWFLVFTLLFSLITSTINAAESDAVRNKDTNTAYITEKTAQWTNVEDYLAEITLKINGSKFTDPLDVVIVLDRSGSMDMNFIQEIPDGNGGKKGIHNASSPCLNQDHFYLAEVNEAPTVIPNSIDDMHYDDATKRLTVYNEEKQQWVVLDTENEIHLYFQFGNTTGDIDSLVLGAYHFKYENDAFIRISKWDTTDVRKGTADGIWDHADESEGCYDRWIEAKKAVSEFSKKLLQINAAEGLTGDQANRVALVPFSIRDETLPQRLNNDTPYYRDWLVQNGYFDNSSVTVNGGVLSGSYDSKVGWTENSNTITSALPKLFTTHSTDYMYGLSEAYNLLDSRTPIEKANKKAIVLFMSDGTPDPATGTLQGAGNIYAFYNNDSHIYGLAEAIESPTDKIVEGSFFAEISGPYQRHSVNPNILARDENNKIIGAYGQNADIISIGYMLDSDDSIQRLQNMAFGADDYIGIPANSLGTTENYLTEKLLNTIVIPGGKKAVLKDQISKYYYVPEDAVLPAGVSIEGTIEDGQTVVWKIGNIYEYTKANEPTITIPIVLKEEYRKVHSTTYYPTNNDNPEPDLYTPENGPDNEDTGAKLYYINPEGKWRYDTIGTPKLPVYPIDPIDPTELEKPTPPTGPKPIETPEELVKIVMLSSKRPITVDNNNISLYITLLFIGAAGIITINLLSRKNKHTSVN